jgi:two-component system, cell cycle sensor histidine kinase and response regulator CckA
MAFEQPAGPVPAHPVPSREPAFTPLRIAALYAIGSAVWIVGSDRALAAMVSDPALITRLQTIKGWGFVSATAVMLYLMVRDAISAAHRSAQALDASEAALRERETQFHAVFESAGLGISILDLDQTVLLTNPALDAMLGYAPGALVGRHVSTYWDPDHPTSTLESRRQRLDALLAGEARYSLDRGYRRADGSALPVHVTVTLVRDADGTPRYEVGVIEDLTERHRVEAALTESEARLRQAQKMEAVGRLAGGIAHDFNNLLTVILGNADLALDALTDAGGHVGDGPRSPAIAKALRAAREEVSELRGAAERAASVTQQLLAFSRKQVMQPTLLELDEVVSGVERLVRRLISDDVRLERVSAPTPGLVRADRGRLEQVVMNLMLNARDAMPDGGTLTLTTAETDVDVATAATLPGMVAGRFVTLAVRDTGTGMDAATRSRLFEPFFTTKPQGEGTGLGLSTVYGIVKQSDGFVYADSEPGQGSTFTVYLPRVEHVSRATSPTPSAVRSVAPGGRATVLVVDDEPAVREITRRLLERSGFDVRVATNGAEALREWERDPAAVDLVLTDLAMPGMDGRTLIGRLRERDPSVRVLCMSGFAGPDGMRDDAVLEKPFTVAELLARVREALNG